MSSEPDLQTLTATARRRHLGVTVGLLVLAALAYAVVLVATSGQLPATMATHFDLSGQPDDFMATPVALLAQGAALVLIPGALLLLMAAGQWWKGASARFVSALVAGVTALLTVLFVALTLAHVGVADPTEVRLTLTVGLLALGAGVVAAVGAALLLPGPLPRQESLQVEPIALGETSRAAWFGTASTGQGALLLIGASILAVALAAILSANHWLWILAAVLVLLTLGVTSFSAAIDRRGLHWRAALGFPRGHIGLDAITDATVIQVSIGDFGGFGLRHMPGRLGLITRSGPALSVQHGGGELVITVDDAATAAAMLKGLMMARTRQAGAH